MPGVLFPHLSSVSVDGVCVLGRVVRIDASTHVDQAVCPVCGVVSGRVHSRYQRQLSDTAIAGREVLIRLRVRRFFCGNTDCGRRTFAEQVSGLTKRHARRSGLLEEVLLAVALDLGGRAGARMTQHLAAMVSRMTLLRLIRVLPDPARPTPRVLGVGDFALQRDYRPSSIDRKKPSITVRSSSFAEGVRIQVIEISDS